MSGPGLSDLITGTARAALTSHVRLKPSFAGTDPLKDNLPLVACVPTPIPGGGAPDASAVMTAQLVSELSDAMRAVLEQHPVNAERAKEGLSLANVVLLR